MEKEGTADEGSSIFCCQRKKMDQFLFLHRKVKPVCSLCSVLGYNIWSHYLTHHGPKNMRTLDLLMVYKAEDNFNFFFYSLMSAVFRTSCSIHEKRNVEVELFIQEVIMHWFYWSKHWRSNQRAACGP